MSLKREIAKEMQLLENEIKALEVKRTRSMAALLESLISKEEPSSEEMRYFRTYTSEIDVKREKLTELTKQLSGLV